jgi:DNA-binding transcriptional ArsR family regulator
MPATQPATIDRQLARALSHPLRVRILEILSERVASPNELSEVLRADLGHVAYHTRTLDRCGCLELVETAQRRGATEHYYKAAPRSYLSWTPLALDERGWREVTAALERAQEAVLAAHRRSAGRLAGGAGEAGSEERVAAVVAHAAL